MPKKNKLFCEQVKEKQKEYIICSAVWYKDLPLVDMEVPLGHYLPTNCDCGIVFAGRNHMQCMYQMVVLTGMRDAQAGRKVDGFLTNMNRFVRRKEARKIAEKAVDVYCIQKIYSHEFKRRNYRSAR